MLFYRPRVRIEPLTLTYLKLSDVDGAIRLAPSAVGESPFLVEDVMMKRRQRRKRWEVEPDRLLVDGNAMHSRRQQADNHEIRDVQRDRETRFSL